jgi:hypothetical protein
VSGVLCSMACSLREWEAHRCSWNWLKQAGSMLSLLLQSLKPMRLPWFT